MKIDQTKWKNSKNLLTSTFYTQLSLQFWRSFHFLRNLNFFRSNFNRSQNKPSIQKTQPYISQSKNSDSIITTGAFFYYSWPSEHSFPSPVTSYQFNQYRWTGFTPPQYQLYWSYTPANTDRKQLPWTHHRSLPWPQMTLYTGEYPEYLRQATILITITWIG